MDSGGLRHCWRWLVGALLLGSSGVLAPVCALAASPWANSSWAKEPGQVSLAPFLKGAGRGFVPSWERRERSLLSWKDSREERTAKAPGASSRARKRRQPGSGRWWTPLYLIDWGLALGLGVGGTLALEWVPAPEREWSPEDVSLLQPLHLGPSLSLPVGLGFAVGAPLVGMGLAQIHLRSGHDFHHAMLSLVEALAASAFLSQLLQVTVGRLRPDWFERCRPDIETLDCTGDDGLVAQGRRSFPSMAASLSFAGGALLSLYLAGHLHPWRGAGVAWKLPLVLLPVAAAIPVSAIAVWEHRHHLSDVVVGAAIGTGFAILAYHLNFYPLWDTRRGQIRARRRVSWMPWLSPQGVGMAVAGRW